MFVRCSIDDEKYSRDYAIGKVKSIDEFSELLEIQFFDVTGIGDFYPKPENKQYSLHNVSHCKIRIGAIVKYKKTKYIVKASVIKKEDGLYYYYLQSETDKIECLPETVLECSYNDGYVKPLEQLKQYEFQNPMWFFGRSIVSKTMNIINNSLYGFDEIAGCKIFLKTHQLKTIVRCLQDGTCRNMIADEVGMGKTIEALAILKVFLKDNHNSKILILVPDALLEQWEIEMAYKFHILTGKDVNDNVIDLVGVNSFCENASPYSSLNSEESYDFVIADEVHKYLRDDKRYRLLLHLSKRAKNILMLSATPVQRRKDEYKKLLQLIQPKKYEQMSNEKFEELLELQGDVVRRVHEVLEDLDSYLEEIEDTFNEHTEETEEAFKDITDGLKKIYKLINDEMFQNLCSKIDYSSDDFGIEGIQSAIAYVCENYQFERSIIRNRRDEDEDYNLRELIEIPYDMRTNFNNTEYNIYKELAFWIERSDLDYDTFLQHYKSIVSSFFSSAAAFYNELKNTVLSVPEELLQLADNWKNEEAENLENINTYMEDPTGFESRINNIIDFIDQEASEQKVLVFTSFDETFSLFKEAFINYFGEQYCTFFSRNMDSDERELGAYRFETDEDYWILLSDESGGEGRNFQNADILVHIDLPWSANDLEQRIGRLDRIGRERNKPVISVACYSQETLEEDLFSFWNDGIGIFTKSQSGLEIIMNSMDEKIIRALSKDFKYGLANIIEDVNKELEGLKEVIKKERYFDVAEYKYQAINRIMDNTRELYAANEKQLFGDSMMKWSSLSGFRGHELEKSMVRFDASSFSLNSAYNSLFVPPDIRLMISDKINQLQNKVRSMNGDRAIHTDNNYIQGTFDRQIALDNDYIHFFAPGDPIFDSIVNNALNSYKGTCAAFACKAYADWEGFIFTWNLSPDEIKILKKGLSTHLIDKYRGFMPIEQFQCAVSISDSHSVAEAEILKVYNYLMTSDNVNRKKFQHLGKRAGINSNMDIFASVYPPERWEELVDENYKKAIKMVKKRISAKLNKQLGLLKIELLKNSGAKKATTNYYLQTGLPEDDGINEMIFKCFSNPRLVLDSACYVRLINEG